MIKEIGKRDRIPDKINEMIKAINRIEKHLGILEVHSIETLEREETPLEKECNLIGKPGGTCRCRNPKECKYRLTENRRDVDQDNIRMEMVQRNTNITRNVDNRSETRTQNREE